MQFYCIIIVKLRFLIMVSISTPASFLRVFKMMDRLTDPKEKYDLMNQVLPQLDPSKIAGTEPQQKEMREALAKARLTFKALETLVSKIQNPPKNPPNDTKLKQRSITPDSSLVKAPVPASVEMIQGGQKHVEPQKKIEIVEKAAVSAPAAIIQREQNLPEPQNPTPALEPKKVQVTIKNLPAAPVLHQGPSMVERTAARFREISEGIQYGARLANKRLLDPVKGFLKAKSDAVLKGPISQEIQRELPVVTRNLIQLAKGFLPFNSEPAVSTRDGKTEINMRKLVFKGVLAEAAVLSLASSFRVMNERSVHFHPYVFYGLASLTALSVSIYEGIKSANQAAAIVDAEQTAYSVDAFIAADNPSPELISQAMSTEASVKELVEKTKDNPDFLRKNMYAVLPYIQDTDIFMQYYSPLNLDSEEKFGLIKQIVLTNPALLEKMIDDKMLKSERISDEEKVELLLDNTNPASYPLLERLGISAQLVFDEFGDSEPLSFSGEKLLYHPALIEELIQRKVDLQKKDSQGYTLLDHAGHSVKNIPLRVEIYAHLLRATPMSAEEKSRHLRNLPLRFLCGLIANQYVLTTDILAKDQAEIWNRAEEGDIGLLKEYGFDPNVRDEEGFAPLHRLASGGQASAERAKKLIEAGADPLATVSIGGDDKNAFQLAFPGTRDLRLLSVLQKEMDAVLV